MGGVMVNFFNRFGRVWQVYVQAEGEFRTQAEQRRTILCAQRRRRYGSALRAGDDGAHSTAPSSRCATTSTVPRSYLWERRPGYSSGQVMKALEDVFAETMPAGMGFDYMGMSFQEKVAAEGVPASVIFGFSLLFVFLILAAQYESWALPFSVLLGTPVAVFGAFGALWLLKLVAPQASENDVFTQIGLVMLIGLAAKNAILIVEFAKVEHEGGKPFIDAALAAARVRLRPILMTAFAFILGVVPLVLATGAGAHGRVLLGLAVFGGMLAASVIAIFLIPVTYYVVEKLSGRRDKTTPGAPASGTPKTAGDGQRPKPALEPTRVPTHARLEGGH